MAVGGGALPRGRAGRDGPAEDNSGGGGGGGGGNRLTNVTTSDASSGAMKNDKNIAGSGNYGHVLHTNLGSLSGVGVTSQAYSPHQQWLVLRSLATNTFVSVEPPPHAEAMVVHGRGESISLNNVFGILRGGYLWAKSTASLLNVCSTAHEVCTGFLEREGDPHVKRLAVPLPSANFEIRRVKLPPLAPKPAASAVY